MTKKVIRTCGKFALKGLLPFVLAISIGVGAPLSAFAAEKKEYISELKWSFEQGTDTNGKKWLTDNGYKIVPSSSIGRGSDSLYLGYKSTTNPEEAITDIAVMDMSGGYSFSEYENLLDEQKAATQKIVNSLLLGVKEYRDNHAAGSPAAKYARDMMNQYKEDDSGQLIGDFLLDPAVGEEKLTAVFMQANGAYFTAIKENLALACSPYGKDAKGNEKTTWMERLSKLGVDGITEAKKEDRHNTKAAYLQRLCDIMEPEMKQYLKVKALIDAAIPKDADTPENKAKALKIVEENYPPENILNFSTYATVYNVLASFQYTDEDSPNIKNLADLAIRSSELSSFDFHAMASILTEAEYQMMTVIGIPSFITTGGNTEENWQRIRKEIEALNLKKPPVTSIYDGVDRELYQGNVALTSDSIRASNMSTDGSALYGNISQIAEIALFTLMATSVAVAIGAVAYAKINNIVLSVVVDVTKTAAEPGTISVLRPQAYSDEFLRMAYPENYARFFSVAGKVFCASMAVLGVLMAVYIGFELAAYYDNDYTTMPHIMMDTLIGPDQKTSYVKYNAVTQQTKNTMGNYITDLNVFEGSQWIIMYTTKDKAAGAPITTDMMISTSSAAKAPYVAVHRFGEKDAFDLQKHNGLLAYRYGYFVRDEDAFKTTGSVFTSAMPPIIAGIAGAMAGAAGCFIVLKRKRKKDDSNPPQMTMS